MVASCWAIGRSSEDATNASLILCARTLRRRRSAGLTYFFRPRGAVADLLALDFDEPDFFDVVALWSVAEPAGFLVEVFGFWPVELVVSEDLPAGSSSRFPSTGATANNAQNIPASSRARRCIRRRGKTELIFSM